MKLKLFVSLIFLMMSMSCAQNLDIPSISVEELQSKMDADYTLIILDVRTPQELVGPLGKIDLVINIPVQTLSNRISELEKYKANNFAVICRSGNRSQLGTKILIDNGFNAVNVLGGMKMYRKKIEAKK